MSSDEIGRDSSIAVVTTRGARAARRRAATPSSASPIVERSRPGRLRRMGCGSRRDHVDPQPRDAPEEPARRHEGPRRGLARVHQRHRRPPRTLSPGPAPGGEGRGARWRARSAGRVHARQARRARSRHAARDHDGLRRARAPRAGAGGHAGERGPRRRRRAARPERASRARRRDRPVARRAGPHVAARGVARDGPRDPGAPGARSGGLSAPRRSARLQAPRRLRRRLACTPRGARGRRSASAATRSTRGSKWARRAPPRTRARRRRCASSAASSPRT